MYSSSRQSRSTHRGSSYSNPPSRSQTPIRSRSSSLEPTNMSFSRPMSRASSLQNLTSSSSPSSQFLPGRKPVIETSLNRIKSASVTGLSISSSFTPSFSFRQAPSFSSSTRYSSYKSEPMRTSLVDIRRPPTTIDRYPSDRFQSYGTRYSSFPSVTPAVTTFQPMRSSSPVPTSRYYAGANPYLSSYANQQGLGAYTKLLRYSFASGANRDRSSDFTPPAIITRGVNKDRTDRSAEYGLSSYSSRSDYSSKSPYVPRSTYYEHGHGQNGYRYGSSGGSYSYGRSSSQESPKTTYRSSISAYGGSEDSSDLYKTRFQPTSAMSKYWTTPRKLFTA